MRVEAINLSVPEAVGIPERDRPFGIADGDVQHMLLDGQNSHLMPSGDVLLVRTRRVPRLSHEQEHELGTIIQASRREGDATNSSDIDRQNAELQFVVANQRLVRKVAGSIATGATIHNADLMQAGNEGLITAARLYDPTVGVTFGTFAYDIIRKAVQGNLIDLEYPVCLPRNVWQQVKVLFGIRSGFRNAQGREPTLEEWSDAYHARRTIVASQDSRPPLVINPDSLRSLISATQSISFEGRFTRPHDDPHRFDPEAAVIRQETKTELRAAIAQARERMTEQERSVFDMRLPQDDGSRLTQKAVAKVLGINHSRVGQLDTAANTKLRAELLLVDPKYARYGARKDKSIPASMSDTNPTQSPDDTLSPEVIPQLEPIADTPKQPTAAEFPLVSPERSAKLTNPEPGHSNVSRPPATRESRGKSTGRIALSVDVLPRVPYTEGDDKPDDWRIMSLCSEEDPELFFPEKSESDREAKQICQLCDVRTECLDYALDNNEKFGIWGGTSERERRQLKRAAG